MPMGRQDPIGALLQPMLGKPGVDMMRQDAGALLDFLTGLPVSTGGPSELLRAIAGQAASGEILGAAGGPFVPANAAADAVSASAKLPRYRHAISAEHTLERLGPYGKAGPYGNSAHQAPSPQALDLKPYEESIRRRLSGEVPEDPWAGFDFSGLESSDETARYHEARAAAYQNSDMYSNDPLVEAIQTGGTEGFNQTWAIRDKTGNPQWIIDTGVNVGITERTVRGKNVPAPDAREMAQLTIDIARQMRGGGYSYGHGAEEGFNDLGLDALREAATNILGWYQSKGINPEFVGGIRVRQGRGDMQIPASRLKTEVTKAWVALFGAAAVVPDIIIEERNNGQRNEGRR